MPVLRYHHLPLRRLHLEIARRLIAELHAPDQRFARCFHRYWREELGQSDEEAAQSTRAELDASAAALAADLNDPCVHTIGVQNERSYEPVGLYAVRPLSAHPIGRQLDASLGPGPLGERRGFCHSLGVRDDHAGLLALRTIFVHIARLAFSAGFDVLYFYSSDARLAGIYRHFGMDFPDGLRVPGSRHLVGRYLVHRADNLARVAHTAERVGISHLHRAS